MGQYIDVEQGREAWFSIRAGKVTASRVSDVVARTKSGWSASRQRYMGEKIAERLTGAPCISFQSKAMEHGIETEDVARAAYEFAHDIDVVQVGFVDHPRIENFGCSPDGLVGDQGLVEIKAPMTHTHIETLLTNKIPTKYQIQMLVQMACTDRQWCDFVSFDPRMPEHMQMWVKRVERDDERIAQLETDVTTFLDELDAKVTELSGQYGA